MGQQQILNNRFEVAPSSVSRPRSTFVIPFRHLTTGNFGDVIPFFAEMVNPGDTFQTVTKCLTRMSTPLFPVMDEAWIQTFYFFVPMRLLWSHWQEFLGENKLSAWVQPVEYVIPHRSITPDPGSLYDHLTVPTYSPEMKSDFGLDVVPPQDINFLFARAYFLIWNEWFRNENTTDPVLVNTGDTVTNSEAALGQTLLKASKLFDAYTSALPSPQKGNAVDVPLLGLAPLVVGDLYPDWMSADHDVTFGTPKNPSSLRTWPSSGTYMDLAAQISSQDPDSVHMYGKVGEEAANQGTLSGYDETLRYDRTYADLSQTETFTINQLRYAFQLQRILERQAIAGSRYVEIIASSFGCRSSDARLQRPEYLGGTRERVQFAQVTQQSSSDEQSPLGHTGAYSKTAFSNRDFVRSFNEHGILMGLACVRHRNTYQQGLNPKFSVRGRYDIYWPELDHIGYQPMFKKEIFATGADSDNEPFGYNEAWWWYRFFPSVVTGQFRSTVVNNLDEWHYADVYAEQPTLSADWMAADKDMVDRTLAVTSSQADQLMLDFAVNITATRVMSMSSYPGMIDHY